MRHPDAIPRGVSEGILRASRAPASPSRGDGSSRWELRERIGKGVVVWMEDREERRELQTNVLRGDGVPDNPRVSQGF